MTQPLKKCHKINLKLYLPNAMTGSFFSAVPQQTIDVFFLEPPKKESGYASGIESAND